MQRDSSPGNQQKTYCHSCGRYILTSNFLLHEGRCQRMSQLRSSRVSQKGSQQIPNFQQKRQNHESQKKQSSKYSYPNMNKKQFIGSMKKTNSNMMNNKNSQNQVQQKIPCPFCGYMQSLIELDTHPNQCQHRQIECQYCRAKYPNSLMLDHKQICQKNPRNIQRNRRNQMRRNQPQPYYEEEQDEMVPMFMRPRSRNMYNPSPLMNFLSDPFLNQFLGNRPQRNNEPNFQMFQFSSNNGQPTRVIFRSNSSNPSTFIQLIQMLARRANPNQNPGLNQQQLSQLTKTKYHKKSQEPDLCTICYCQFQQNQQIIELKCKHMFHQECIFQWLKRVSTCPVCKKKLKQGSSNQQDQWQDLQENQNHQQSHQHSHQQPRNNNSRQNQGNSFNPFQNFFRF